ncbi:unnamed protein product [Nesidiocoris tenuis]|uniref:Uncharacterized protein n=1 Tax=Nesidiocoris tenuis TaxID=355587 RepID=A0A6H5G2Y2_9HEMI|nr:unnamed protein product [Nesidiocoris tenuis]
MALGRATCEDDGVRRSSYLVQFAEIARTDAIMECMRATDARASSNGPSEGISHIHAQVKQKRSVIVQYTARQSKYR